MRNFGILLSFIPWITFWLLYTNEVYSILVCACICLALTIIIDSTNLKSFLLLPWTSLLCFAGLTIITFFEVDAWIGRNSILLINLCLIVVIWMSIVLYKPFTLQYAKQRVMPIYSLSPLFFKIQWVLSIVWALSITIVLVVLFCIKYGFIPDSIVWSYIFPLLCFITALYLNNKLPNLIIGNNFWDTVAKLPKISSRFLESGYRPVREEYNYTNLVVEGEIPNDLRGCYMRNGPNPYFEPYTYTYPIDGDGLIHRITFSDKGVSYKSRFVKTKGLIAEIRAGGALFAGFKLPIIPDPQYISNEFNKNTASINLLRLDKYRILALYEAAPAYVLTNNLDTIGRFKPNKIKNFLLNAHYRRDYTNNQTYMFSYCIDQAKYFLRLYEFDANFKLIKNIVIPKANATMIHDFVITKNYVIFFDVPAIFNVLDNPGNEPFFTFNDQHETSIYLINRHDFTIKTINKLDSFFVFHFINAFELNDENAIIVNFIYYERLDLNQVSSINSKEQPLLYRGKINLDKMSYEHYPLAEDIVEFPSYNLKLTGYKNRYAYLLSKMIALPQRASGFNAIIKYDLDMMEKKVISFGDDLELDEAIFVPRVNAQAEDDGYLMCFVYDKNSDKSDFVICNANGNNEILAKVKLPVRVPHGLHGMWSSS